MTTSEQKLRSLLAKVLNVPEGDLRDDSGMTNVRNWDSLRHMAIVVALEEEFKLRPLTMEEIVALTSVGAIKRVLQLNGLEC